MYDYDDGFVRISNHKLYDFFMYISETLRKREEYDFKHDEDRPIEPNT